MKLFSDCHDECIVCANSGMGCLAGHGDDDFSKASKKQLIERLSTAKASEEFSGRKGRITILEKRLNEWYGGKQK